VVSEEAVRAPPWVVAALLGVGAAATGLAIWVNSGGGLRHPSPAPAGSGDVGVVFAFGQGAGGAIRLVPDRETVLRRPQELTFQWWAEGTGPRRVRLELAIGEERTVEHDERVRAPADHEGLPLIMRLGDATPDRLEIVATVEAPHAQPRVIRYPIRLLPPE
jgi:hypothetical protein